MSSYIQCNHCGRSDAIHNLRIDNESSNHLIGITFFIHIQPCEAPRVSAMRTPFDFEVSAENHPLPPYQETAPILPKPPAYTRGDYLKHHIGSTSHTARLQILNEISGSARKRLLQQAVARVEARRPIPSYIEATWQ